MTTAKHDDDKAKDWKADAVPPPAPKVEKAKVTLVNDAFHVRNDDEHYPFTEMKPGQGFFVPNEPNQTTAQNAAKVHSHIVAVNDLYSEVETDENGDEVWEEVYVRTAKRNADGTVALDAGGRPIVGHDPISRPNLVYSRHYILRQIAKDDMIAGKKADADGVLVARLF